ncbi:hypothetical protein RFF05_06520 [Bengtsoniella intestinalis]|uniref:hypothetical protein n=1 Tax=Bengtsoniella intestinalis TaxID=3073143 RepID=UPI00391F56D3
MRKTLPLFSLLMAYLTEVTAFCNLMMFFASTKANNYAYVEMWPWLALCAVYFLGLHLFLRGQRTLEQTVVVVIGSLVAILSVMSLLFIHVVTIVGWGFAWSLIAITVVRGAVLLLRGCDTHTVVLGCELPMFGIGFLLWMDACQVYYLPPYYIACTVGVLLLNLVGLSLARMYSINGANGMNNGAVVGTAAMSFGAIGIVAALFVRFASVGAKTAVDKTTQFVTWLYNLMISAVTAILNWFLSLFPVSDYDAMDLELGESVSLAGEMEEMQELNAELLMAMVIVGFALVLLAILRLFFKLRKMRLSMKGHILPYHRPHQRVGKRSLWKRFLAFLQRCYQRLAFSVTLFFRRNTLQGTVLILLRLGKKRGLAKGVGESYGAYLHRLSTACAGVDAEVAQSMSQLATMLDATLYGGATDHGGFTAHQYEKMRHTLRKLPIKTVFSKMKTE